MILISSCCVISEIGDELQSNIDMAVVTLQEIPRPAVSEQTELLSTYPVLHVPDPSYQPLAPDMRNPVACYHQ